MCLYETLLPNGYYVVHPNCRCELRPVILEYEDEETTKAKREYSNSELKDPRTDRQKELYDKWQANNRRNAREMREYYEMKELYGDKIPYKTLGGYRRASRSNSIPPNIKKYQYRERDTEQYERWSEIIGKKNMPKDIDTFQEMKYNEIKKFEELKTRKDNAYLDMDFDTVIERVGTLPNNKVRKWYNKNVHSIPNQLDKTKSLKEQAIQACELRNKFRTEARGLMKDIQSSKKLDAERPNLSFLQLVEKYKIKYNINDDSAYKKIIDSATHTNKIVNDMFLKKEE